MQPSEFLNLSFVQNAALKGVAGGEGGADIDGVGDTEGVGDARRGGISGAGKDMRW